MRRAWLILVTGISLLSLGCGQREANTTEATVPRPFMSTVSGAIAVVAPMNGSGSKGVVRFIQAEDNVRVAADFDGLPAGSKHALHIHELGDCTNPDGGSAGGHYTPHVHAAGEPTELAGHSGNLGDMQADASGKAHFEVSINNASVAGVERPIVGRAVIVDAEAGAGGKHNSIGCGVIGIAGTKK